MTNPNTSDVLAEFTAQIEAARVKVAQAEARIAKGGATVTSPDGAVRVTVAPSGALVDLVVTDRAAGRSPQQIAALIMEQVRRAQQGVSSRISAAFGGLVGETSEAMQVLTQYLPTDAVPDEQGDDEWPPAAGEDDQRPSQEVRPATPPKPDRRSQARPRPDETEDDDTSDPW
jgi:DNA-binding protein YbaB